YPTRQTRRHVGPIPLRNGIYPVMIRAICAAETEVMSATGTLLSEIEAFSRQAGIKPSTLGRKAVNDGKLHERLRNGGSVTLETADRIRRWMREYRVEHAA